MKKKRIIICGQSDAGYPRDRTLMSAFRSISPLKIYDLRFIRKKYSIFSQIDILTRIQKRILLWRIYWLVRYRHIDAIFIMKLNYSLVNRLYEITCQRNIKIIYDLWVSRYIKAQRDNKDIEYWFQKEKKIIDICSYLVCTTEAYKKFYSETFLCNSDKIVVVPLAVEQEWLDTPLCNKKPDSTKINVGYWGNFLKQHGIEIALQTAKRFEHENNIQFYFMGNLNELDSYILDQYKRLRNVKFLPYTENRKSLIQFIDRMDISFGHLKPIHDAHLMLPNKALEGMARGKNVIHIHSDSLHKEYQSFGVVGSGIDFYDGSPEKLAKKIENKSKSDCLQKLENKSRQIIVENHSINTVFRKLRHFIDQKL